MLGAELPLGLREVERESAPVFSLYPNPSRDGVRVEGLNGCAPYRILDLQGRVVSAGRAANGHALDTDVLSPGVYLVQLSGKAGWGAPQRWVKL